MYLDEATAEPIHVGTLRASFQGERRLAASSFEYSAQYLARGDRYALSPDLPLGPGKQYSGDDQTLFGAFSDAAPDDWGSALIDEAYSNEREEDQPAALGAFDHLVQLNDSTRMGALRFRAHGAASPHESGAWLTKDRHTNARVSDAKRLAEAAARFEVYEATDEDMEILGAAGSSLGGARPKATVAREDGTLWMLKLPSNRDRRADIEAWEAVALELAYRAGLNVPRFQLVPIEGYNSSLLVERFDRTDGSRLAYISAMTAMGIGSQQHQRTSYEDLADTVDALSGAHGSRGDLRELFGRVALSVLIGNVDDHWKNHGFLRNENAWRLSPIFDVNPNRPSGALRGRSLSAKGGSGERDLRVLLNGADAYALSAKDAATVLDRVVTAVEGWRDTALGRGIAAAEIEHMAPAFSESQLGHAKSFLAAHHEPSAS